MSDDWHDLIRLALRSVRARWGRVVLTALAIVASTAFLSGTFIFRDTVQRTFNALFADVFERVDGYVQSSNSVDTLFGFERRDRLPVDVDRAGAGRRWSSRCASVRAGRCSRDRQAGQADRAADCADVRRNDQHRVAVGVADRSGSGAQRTIGGGARHHHRGRRRLRGGRHGEGQLGGRIPRLHTRRHRGLRQHRLARQRDMGAVRRTDGGGVRRQARLRRRGVGEGGWLGLRRRAGVAGPGCARSEPRRDVDVGADHRAVADRDRTRPRVHHPVPGDLLVHRAGCRDVRDLQRVLDHRRATPTARTRCCAPSVRVVVR